MLIYIYMWHLILKLFHGPGLANPTLREKIPEDLYVSYGPFVCVCGLLRQYDKQTLCVLPSSICCL